MRDASTHAVVSSISAPAAIDAPSHPAVRRLRDILRAGAAVRRTIVVEDEENIVQAVRRGVRLDSVFLARGADLGAREVADAVRSQRVPVHRLSGPAATAVFGSERRSRVLALIDRPPARSLADIAAASGDVVILDGVRLPGNIGAITRSAAALGAAGIVLVDSGLTSIWDRRLIRASRGLLFALPIVQATRAEVAAFAAETSLILVGLAAGAAAPLTGLSQLPDRLALLLGGEREGASAELTALCARQFAIPTDPDVESLNVSVAGAIALYERGRRAVAGARR